MVDNTSITPGTGESIRDKDRAGVKTQIVGIDVAIGTGTEALLSTSNPMPVTQTTSIPAGTNTIGAITGSGAAGTPATGVQTVQGISGGTAQNTNVVAALPAGTNTIGAFKKAPATTGTISSAALAVTSFTVLAANTNRLGATVYNDSTNVLYLAMAATSSTTAYTVQITAGGYWELPNDGCGYTGILTGIALAATGNVRVTELT